MTAHFYTQMLGGVIVDQAPADSPLAHMQEIWRQHGAGEISETHARAAVRAIVRASVNEQDRPRPAETIVAGAAEAPENPS